MKCLALLCLVGCSDDITTINSGELITSVVLTFDGTSFTADDPDGDGGQAPAIDPITIAAGTTTLALRFENRLEDPPEDITEEVMDEGEAHQVFFTGSATTGPLAITYADTDRNGLPIGLATTVVATPGTGMLTITLRHMPPLNDTPVKTADLAAQVKTTGTAALPGGSDAVVTFPVTVQ
jgi:hypothetical protein